MRSIVSLASAAHRQTTLRNRAAHSIRRVARLARDPRLMKVRLTDAVDDGVRGVKRSMQRSFHSLEDARDAAAYQIKRAPFKSIALTAGGGLFVGTIVTWATHRKE
jgi:ElaB/YqjD/DUF883 family membrane-anchored ribosome-binding protein